MLREPWFFSRASRGDVLRVLFPVKKHRPDFADFDYDSDSCIASINWMNRLRFTILLNGPYISVQCYAW